MDAGLLPVKRLSDAKQRLGSHFNADQRLDIARALLADALDLCATSDFLAWWVISSDDEVLDAAARSGLGRLKDSGEGLNTALAAGTAAAAAAGAESVSIIPVDVPLAFSGDLIDLLDTGATSDLVVVPAGEDGGTNALYLSPPEVIEPQFGPGSLHRHIASSERLGLRCSMLSLPRLALDIDSFQDVQSFLERAGEFGGRTAKLLRQIVPAVSSSQ